MLNITSPPDVLALRKAIYWIEEILGNALGFAVMAVIIIVPIISAWDLIVITNPMLLNKALDGSKVGICSKDARRAIEIANGINTGRSAVYEYLMMRSKTYVVCVVILFLVVSGMYNDVRMFITQVVGTIVGIFIAA